MPKLIGSVTVTPPQAVPGQSVHVQVLDPSGKPYTADSGVTIALDGIPVASRYYQFPTAGTRIVAVYASEGGTAEAATAAIHVAGAPLGFHRTIVGQGEPAAPAQMPFLVLDQDISTPYQASFSLATPPAARAAAARAIAAADTASARKPVPAAVVRKAPEGFSALQALFPTTTTTTPAPARHMVLQKPIALPPASTSYVWTFGDGQTATTTTPSATHDYLPSISAGRVPFAFDVSCRIVHDNLTITRTLVLYSAYGMCQRNGIVVPHVEGDIYATLNSARTSFAASLLVYNIEATAITINETAIVPVWNDIGATFPTMNFNKMANPVTIAAHSSSLLAIQVSRSDLVSAAKGAAVTGFIVAFQGILAAPPPVRLTTVMPKEAVLPKPAIVETPTTPPKPGVPIVAIGTASTVRFSRHVRLRLQDQQLPIPSSHLFFLPPETIIQNFGKIGPDPIISSNSFTVDPATNVISVGLTARAPTPAQVAQVRHSVLGVVSAENAAGGVR